MKRTISLVAFLLVSASYGQELFSTQNLSSDHGQVSIGQGPEDQFKVLIPFEDTKNFNLVDGCKITLTLSKESVLKLKVGEAYTIAYKVSSMRNIIHYTSSSKFVLEEIKVINDKVVICSFKFQVNGKLGN